MSRIEPAWIPAPTYDGMTDDGLRSWIEKLCRRIAKHKGQSYAAFNKGLIDAGWTPRGRMKRPELVKLLNHLRDRVEEVAE